MFPKKSNILYDKVAELTGEDKELVEDIINFTFSHLRKTMGHLDQIRFSLPFMTFETNKKLLNKEITRILSMRECYKKRGLQKKYVAMRESLFTLKENIEKERDEYDKAKVKKLKWHKENGDPYGVYKKELAANTRRYQELLKEEQVS